MRVIQLHLSAWYGLWSLPLHQLVPVSGQLRWRICTGRLQTEIPFPHPTPTLILTAVASKGGWVTTTWGIAFEACFWSPSPTQHHISILEIWAHPLARDPYVEEPFLLIQPGNRWSQHLPPTPRGTRSPSLCQQVINAPLLTWCQGKRIQLTGEHVPEGDSLIVDALSKGVSSHPWSDTCRGPQCDGVATQSPGVPNRL